MVIPERRPPDVEHDANLLGSCVGGLRGTDAATFDLTVTSNLYGDQRIFGGDVYDWLTFRAVADELWRTTKPGGVVCWQTGDDIHQSGPRKGSYRLTPQRQAIDFQRLGFLLWCHLITPTEGQRYANPRRYLPSPQEIWVFSKGEPTTTHIL